MTGWRFWAVQLSATFTAWAVAWLVAQMVKK